MAKNYGFLICILVLVMDIVAGILGIQAEIAQNKKEHMKVGIFECRVPSHQAFKLGLAAAILLSLAHIIANLLGGCICVWTREQYEKATANKQLAVAFLIFSWIILAVALSMLIIGILANRRSRQSCNLLNHRLLSIGGILCFIHGLFTVPYYVSASATKRDDMKRRQEIPRPAAAGRA